MHYQLIIIFSILFSVNLNEWENITSILSPEKIIKYNNRLLGSTPGGLLVYDLSEGEFNQYDNNYSDCISISDFQIDSEQNLWVLCENGLLFRDDSSLFISHLDIEEAYELVIENESIFMLYTNNDLAGVIEISYVNNEIFFDDYYQGFASVDASFVKLSILDNVIYLLTDEGVYYASLDSDLKYPSNWSIIENTQNVLDILPFEERMLFLSDSVIDFMNVEDVLEGNLSTDLTVQFEVGSYIDLFSYASSNVSESRVYILGNDRIISIDNEGNSLMHYEDDFNNATSLFADENNIYLGIKDQGFWLLNNEISKCSPNTLLSADIEALSYNNGSLYGVNRDGVFIYDESLFFNLLSNRTDSFFLTDSYDCNYFEGDQIDYVPGNKISSSLVFHDQKLYMPNSGILPDQYNKGGVVVVDLNNLTNPSIIDTTYLDGLGGIYYDDIDNYYLTINQILRNNDKIWIVNPYAEHTNHILTYFDSQNDIWGHIESSDETSYLPQEIAFDQWGRIWVAFRNESAINGGLYSSGGIKLVTESGNWLDIENLESLPGDDENVNVWSLDFGEFEGNDILWLLTSNGVQGYSISGTRIDPIYPIDFFTNIPFSKGDKIRVDPQNNVWIVTAHSGVRVIKNDISFWPSSEGLTTENSEILSDVVRDVAFDNNEGIAFLATDKGISILGVPFKKNKNNVKVGVSPNPFIVGESNYLTIEDIYSGSNIKVMTLNGDVVKKINLPYNENRINWDGTGDNGRILDSGIYFIVIENNRYGNGVTKLAIIK